MSVYPMMDVYQRCTSYIFLRFDEQSQ